MANTPNMKPMYVRAIPQARTALKKLLAELSGRDERINQEVFVTASWLWLEQYGADRVYAAIEPFLGPVKAAIDAEKAMRRHAAKDDRPRPTPQPIYGRPAEDEKPAPKRSRKSG